MQIGESSPCECKTETFHPLSTRKSSLCRCCFPSSRKAQDSEYAADFQIFVGQAAPEATGNEAFLKDNCFPALCLFYTKLLPGLSLQCRSTKGTICHQPIIEQSSLDAGWLALRLPKFFLNTSDSVLLLSWAAGHWTRWLSICAAWTFNFAPSLKFFYFKKRFKFLALTDVEICLKSVGWCLLEPSKPVRQINKISRVWRQVSGPSEPGCPSP